MNQYYDLLLRHLAVSGYTWFVLFACYSYLNNDARAIRIDVTQKWSYLVGVDLTGCIEETGDSIRMCIVHCEQHEALRMYLYNFAAKVTGKSGHRVEHLNESLTVTSLSEMVGIDTEGT